MSSVEIYNFKDPNGLVIENGVMKGIEEPFAMTHSHYGKLILDVMKANPNFVGQIDGLTGREETFLEMMEKSIKCAMWLKKLNIQPGDVIGICTHNQLDMYVPCYASLYIGAVFNAWWHVRLTEELTKHFLTLTEPKVLFANEETAKIALKVIKEIGAETKIIVFGKIAGLQSLDDILQTQDRKIVPEFRCTELKSPNDPAVIMYTSGSSGLPKGCLYSHRALIINVNIFDRKDDVGKSRRTLNFSPISWLTGLHNLLGHVITPDTRIVYPEFTEESTFELIEKFKVDWMLVGTSVAIRLEKSPAKTNHDRSSLKLFLTGGSPLTQEKQDAIAALFRHAKMVQGYGSTEVGSAVIQQEDDFKPGSCGRIFSNVSMKVVDPETGKILGPNKTGEAHFKTSTMMTCYYNNPEETREVIDSEGWLHSGDLVRYDEEGHIFFVDRMKEMMKFQGNHVSPGIIENLLLTHPQVLEVAVLAIPHEIDGELPIAFVATTPNATVKKEDLQKLVSDTLPDYMKLRGGVKFLESLPHTSSNKIARSDLRKLAKSYAVSQTPNF